MVQTRPSSGNQRPCGHGESTSSYPKSLHRILKGYVTYSSIIHLVIDGDSFPWKIEIKCYGFEVPIRSSWFVWCRDIGIIFTTNIPEEIRLSPVSHHKRQNPWRLWLNCPLGFSWGYRTRHGAPRRENPRHVSFTLSILRDCNCKCEEFSTATFNNQTNRVIFP